MQINKTLICNLILFCALKGYSQSTPIQQQSRYLHLMDRFEIRQGQFSNQVFTGLRPFDRQGLMEDSPKVQLNKTENYLYASLLMNNQEWYKGDRSRFSSRKPLLKYFYQSPAHAYAHYGKDYFVAVDPLFHFRQSFSNQASGENLFLNQRGLTVRGGIANQVGFTASVMDVQERAPSFVRNWEDSLQSVPGANFYKRFKSTGFDYIDARGSFTFKANKYIRFQAGYDRNFIGSGYRSLLLSDFAGNNLFVKINTRFWKLNYQNLFMELHAGASDNTRNYLVPKKYASMHHLSMNIRPWLNIGFFEAVVFGRKDRFEFGYLNPVIFLRSIEGNLGSQDNALIGADFKALLLKRVQIYGQFMLDEFNITKLRQDASWWGNKTGIQAGFKYIDVAGIQNLDIQGELNRVRPFTYSHFDSISNYTHYNQPLAHPLGANFNELIGVIRYHPVGKLNITARIISWKQGLDSAGGYNSGSDLFRLSNDGRNSEFGYKQLNGVVSKGLNAGLVISYEWRENIFLDAHAMLRKQKTAGNSNQVFIFGLGLRMNLWYRDYDY